ncbi:MAG: hypothetical protein PHO41_00225 [Eubacteriales bacterium]|nr:hypothetical protein [Eubacteriales bacterium]
MRLKRYWWILLTMAITLVLCLFALPKKAPVDTPTQISVGGVDASGYSTSIELSSFMLTGSVKGSVSIPNNTLVTVPETGDNSLSGTWGSVLMLAAFELASGLVLARLKRKI